MNLLKTLATIIIFSLLVGCSSDDDNSPTTSSCELTDKNIKFTEIELNMNYNEVETIMDEDGDNYRNDNTGNSVLKYYKWIFCDQTYTYIQAWFLDDKITLKEKTFQDNSCSNGINEQNFSAIVNGDSYESVSSLLGNIGDNYRVDYNHQPNNSIIKYYRWYDCSDSSRNIEVWFKNDEAMLITKKFQ